MVRALETDELEFHLAILPSNIRHPARGVYAQVRVSSHDKIYINHFSPNLTTKFCRCEEGT